MRTSSPESPFCLFVCEPSIPRDRADQDALPPQLSPPFFRPPPAIADVGRRESLMPKVGKYRTNGEYFCSARDSRRCASRSYVRHIAYAGAGLGRVVDRRACRVSNLNVQNSPYRQPQFSAGILASLPVTDHCLLAIPKLNSIKPNNPLRTGGVEGSDTSGSPRILQPLERRFMMKPGAGTGRIQRPSATKSTRTD